MMKRIGRVVMSGCVFGLMAMLGAGCGSSGGVSGGLGLGGSLSPASGVATFDGQPVEKLTLQLVPVDLNTGEGLITTTGPGGRFELATTDGRTGGPPGRYKVSILPSFMVDQTVQNRIPATYKDPSLTDLVVEIPEGGSTDLKIDFKAGGSARPGR